MKSKTNLGGAISVTGTTLIGIGVLTQLTQFNTATNVLSAHQLAAMWYVALAGFILSAIGKGVTAYFSADASDVDDISKTVNNIQSSNQTPHQPPKTP